MPLLDRLDRRILAALQHDAAQPSDALGDQIGLSASAVQRRIARLKRDGVIERVCALVDPTALGLGVTVVVEVEIDNERRQATDGFQRFIANAPEVQSCWYVTGDVDYVLLVAAHDLDGYLAFVDRLMTEQPIVRKFKSLVCLKTVKRGLALPIEA